MTVTTVKETRFYVRPNEVLGILERGQTQFRRLIKDRGALEWLAAGFEPGFVAHPDNKFCPWQPGDKLWAAEAWDIALVRKDGPVYGYRADWDKSPLNWKSPIHMPREACRIELEVARSWCERIQGISEEDARSCGGVEWLWKEDGINPKLTNRLYIRDHWNEKNNKPGQRFEDNPWAWAVEFRRAA